MADYRRVFPSSFDAETPDSITRTRVRGRAHNFKLPPSRPHRGHRSPCSCCCCYACASIAALLILLLLLVTASVFYFLLDPKAPNFSVTRVYISEFTMTTQPVHSSKAAPQAGFYLQTDVNFTVQTGNPNRKIGIYYEQVNVELLYDDEGVKIGQGSLPSFFVGVKENKSMELRVTGQDKLVSQSMALLLKQQNSMWMEVTTDAVVRIQVWGWNSRSVKVVIKCNVHISRPQPHSGAHLLSKSCKPKLPWH